MKYRDKHIDIMHEVIVPVSDEDDAIKTVEELSYFDPDHITVVYVVQNTEQVPSDIHKEDGNKMHEIVEDAFPDANFEIIETSDSVESAIVEEALNNNATSIVFRPDQESTISKIFSKDKNMKLITHSSVPVIALPDPEDMN